MDRTRRAPGVRARASGLPGCEGLSAPPCAAAATDLVEVTTTMKILKIVLALTVLGAIALAVFAWTMPADVGYRYGAKYLGPVVLSGVRGTVWNGEADGVSLFGQDIGRVTWQARKLPLLGGRFVADVRVKGTDVDLAGTLERGADGVGARELRFSLPAERLAPAFGGDLHLLGTISGVIDRATLRDAMLHGVAGNARWSEAGVSGAADARFSDIIAEFSSRPDGSVGGRVHDDGNGGLAVDGGFELRVGEYRAQASLRARDDPAVAEALGHIGMPQADGSTRIEVAGPLLRPF